MRLLALACCPRPPPIHGRRSIGASLEHAAGASTPPQVLFRCHDGMAAALTSGSKKSSSFSPLCIA